MQCGASRPGIALVAWCGGVFRPEVGAAGPLQRVAPDRGQVAQLRGRGLEDGLRENGVVGSDPYVHGDLVQFGQRTDAQTAVFPNLDTVESRQGADVEHPCRVLDADTGPVQQLGASGQQRHVTVSSTSDHVVDRTSSGVGKATHLRPLPVPLPPLPPPRSAGRPNSGKCSRSSTPGSPRSKWCGPRGRTPRRT